MEFDLGGKRPNVHPDAYIAPTAVLIGDVVVEAGASVWFGAVLRGDEAQIKVGQGANVQDNAVLHCAENLPTILEPNASVGHSAQLEGCVVEQGAVVGMGATMLQRSRLGASESDLVLVSFGLIHPRRRIEDILDALAELGRRPLPARLWILGGEAEYDPETAKEYGRSLRQRVAALGLGRVVDWLDHADPETVSATLAAADVAVLLYPDGASGRNTTLQAALEHGLPVVTTAGVATPAEMRQNPRLVFLPAGSHYGHELAAAVVEAGRLGVGEADASTLPEHIEFHLGVYRRLRESGAGRVG